MSSLWRIFVVEEDERLNRNIVNMLSQDGYHVQGVTSIADAIRTLWAQEYDIVICGLKTTGADGLELLQWLRTSRPNTRVMIVGGDASETARTQALENGAVSYFEKPLNFQLLREELQRLHQQTGFSASLDSFDLLDVIQVITMSRKNIALLVNTGLEERGVLRFQGGELVWAEYGMLRGEEAFFALAAHKNGNVIHQPWNEQITPNLTQPLSRLILQALQYRTKYAHLQQSGEQKAVTSALLSNKQKDDRPMVSVAEDSLQAVPFVAASQENVNGAGSMNEVTKEWWQPTGKISSISMESVDTPGGDTDISASFPPGEPMPAGPNSGPSATHTMPTGQHVDLPSWLTDSPTAVEMPAVRPSSLTGSAHLPIVSPNRSSPPEWQPPRSGTRTTGPIGPKQATGPQKSISTDTGTRRVSRPAAGRQAASPEWQPSPSPLPPATGQSLPRSEPLQSLHLRRNTTGSLANRQESGQRAAMKSMTGPQRIVKPDYNYAALVSALQTVGYSVHGFIATAIVNMDGQAIAQVAVNNIDITLMCKQLSVVLQGVLQSLDQGAWGHHEETVITSGDHRILMRTIGEERKAFQVLITTHGSDLVESLEVMAKLEEAINAALHST